MFKIISGLLAIFDPIVNWLNTHLIQPLITFYNTIKDGLYALAKMLTELPKAIKKFIQDIRDGFMKLMNGIKDITLNITGSIQSSFAAIIEAIRLKVYYVTQWVNLKVIPPLQNSINEIKDKFKDVLDFIENVVDRVGIIIKGWFIKEVNFVTDKILDFIEEIW